MDFRYASLFKILSTICIPFMVYHWMHFAYRWSDRIFVMAAQGMNEARVNDFSDGLLWRLKWELFEKGDWKSSGIASSKLKCEDNKSEIEELIKTLRLTLEN